MKVGRKIRRRRYKAHTYIPAFNHRGDLIMSERRQRATRRVYGVCVNDVDDVDLPAMFFWCQNRSDYGSSVSARLSRAGFRSFCKHMDMPERRAYPASGRFLPWSACTVAVQSILCEAKWECLAPCIVGSKIYDELLRAQGSGVHRKIEYIWVVLF